MVYPAHLVHASYPNGLGEKAILGPQEADYSTADGVGRILGDADE